MASVYSPKFYDPVTMSSASTVQASSPMASFSTFTKFRCPISPILCYEIEKKNEIVLYYASNYTLMKFNSYFSLAISVVQ